MPCPKVAEATAAHVKHLRCGGLGFRIKRLGFSVEGFRGQRVLGWV